MAVDWTVTFDAGDPNRLAAFWSLALGYVKEAGYDFVDGASLVDPHGYGPAISFLRVPEPKTAKNRCHLDIRPAEALGDDDQRDAVIRAKVAELVVAGGTVIRDATWNGHLHSVVMADPEGNEFCIA